MKHPKCLLAGIVLTVCISLIRTSPTVYNSKEAEKGRHDTPLENLIKEMVGIIDDKLDSMGKGLNNVNRNVEELKQEFETVSQRDKYMDQKFETMENVVRRKLDAIENKIDTKFNDLESRVQQPISRLEKKVDNSKSILDTKLSKKFFIAYDILLLPLVKVIFRGLVEFLKRLPK